MRLDAHFILLEGRANREIAFGFLTTASCKIVGEKLGGIMLGAIGAQQIRLPRQRTIRSLSGSRR